MSTTPETLSDELDLIEAILKGYPPSMANGDARRAVRVVRAALASKPAPTDEWRELFWQVAKELNCLPSTFVDANAHVIRKAKALALAATPAEPAQARGVPAASVLTDAVIDKMLNALDDRALNFGDDLPGLALNSREISGYRAIVRSALSAPADQAQQAVSEAIEARREAQRQLEAAKTELASRPTRDQFRRLQSEAIRLRAALAAQPAPVAFDAEGFRAWVLANLPDDTIIGSSAWWADHLTAWAKRFVKDQPAAPVVPQAPSDESLMQILHDPENQPSQYGTVPMNWVPPGFWLAPDEPTDAMCRAAVIDFNGSAVYKSVAMEALAIEEGIYGDMYKAMRADHLATTKEPAGQEGGA